MTVHSGNRPAEIFGYPADNKGDVAQEVRRRHWCPFMQNTCDKKSRLLNIPFGACSVEHGGGIRAICPHRFDERGNLEDVPMVLENIAQHYFGDLNNTVIFSELSIPNVGMIDYVIVRDKPMTREEVCLAMRGGRVMLQKDVFVRKLNAELRLKLNVPAG